MWFFLNGLKNMGVCSVRTTAQPELALLTMKASIGIEAGPSCTLVLNYEWQYFTDNSERTGQVRSGQVRDKNVHAKCSFMHEICMKCHFNRIHNTHMGIPHMLKLIYIFLIWVSI